MNTAQTRPYLQRYMTVYYLYMKNKEKYLAKKEESQNEESN